MNLIDGLEELSEALSGETEISSFIIFAMEKKESGKAIYAVSGKSYELLRAYAEIGMKLAEEIQGLSFDDLPTLLKHYKKIKKMEE